VILLLGGLPGNSFPNISLWRLLSFDKFAHFFVFAVFSFLWGVAFAKQRKNYLLFDKAPLIACGMGIMYGAIIELLQGTLFVNRSADFIDIIANSIGSALGYVIFMTIYKSALPNRTFN